MVSRRKYSTGGRVLPPVDATAVAPAGGDGPAGASPVTADLSAEADENSLQAQLDIIKANDAVARAKTVEEHIDAMPGLSSNQREWLKNHSEVVVDPGKTMRVKFAHEDALGAGHAQDSPAYYEFLESRLGYRAAAAPAPAAPAASAAPERRSVPMSAPVSRDAMSYDGRPAKLGRVELSPQQREAAAIAGVSDVEYARNLLELARRKSMGMYPDQ